VPSVRDADEDVDELATYRDGLAEDIELLPDEDDDGPLDLADPEDATSAVDDQDLMELSEGMEIQEDEASLADTEPDDQLFESPGTDLTDLPDGGKDRS
jgi:hypothetical protein